VEDPRGAAEPAEVDAAASVTTEGRIELTVVLRPEALSVAAGGPISGMVTARRFRGDHVLITVVVADAPDLELELRGAPLPAVGDAVSLAVDPRGVILIPG